MHANHNTVDAGEKATKSSVTNYKAKSKINLKPVPEIVKQSTKSTKRPHVFIRPHAITKVQDFAKPSKPQNLKKDLKKKHILQEKKDLYKREKHKRIKRPASIKNARGQFEPPSTLAYGFQPMTTPRTGWKHENSKFPHSSSFYGPDLPESTQKDNIYTYHQTTSTHSMSHLPPF